MDAPSTVFPERIRRIVGELPPGGTPPAAEGYPFETVQPAQQGFIERDGVRSYYAVFGESGPWVAFAPIFQIGSVQMLKATAPYLSMHCRVLVMDLRGNGRSDRPQGQSNYSFDHYYADFVAVLDALDIRRLAVIGMSATSMTAIRLAAEQPDRVTHLVVSGGYAESRLTDPKFVQMVREQSERMRSDWAGYLDWFLALIFCEPHSTKQFEDGVRYGWSTTGEIVDWARNGWLDQDVRELARKVRCPTLVIHGEEDHRVPIAKGEEIHALIPDSRMLRIGGGAHVVSGRDPVMFNRAVRPFIGAVPRGATWTRAMARKRRVLFISSPIGLGHVQRDVAIARELRNLHPDIAIDWFTVDPATRYLEREGERVHPITARLANESRHIELMAGEHDLSAFFGIRTMDEIMAFNFMMFLDLMGQEHYDLVIGDEAWDVDYYYHENPELKRQPFVFMTDFVGSLPVEADEREACLCAERNAEDIEHIARYPYIRDASIFIGNPDDVTDAPFGPGLPQIRGWTDRNFTYSGYALPFDPARLADTERTRALHGYRPDEKLAIAAVGGTTVGRALLRKIAAAFPLMKQQVPELRMILVAGPRLADEAFPRHPGLEVRPYVHNLFEHLSCADLALVQGGLSTCMELVATRRPFLSFPLQRHFEQCIHVRRRLANYDADRALDYRGLDPAMLADHALKTMHEPVRYKPVETNGAARAARRIADVLENRCWGR